MNLDERIDRVVVMDPTVGEPTMRNELKQLIRDVLEYVKPEKLITNELRATGGKLTVRLCDIAEMEAKIRELGL